MHFDPSIVTVKQWSTFTVWNKRQKSHLLSQNVFLQGTIYPSEKKKIIGTSNILAWVKVVCCLHYQVLHAKQPWRKLVSGFSFACNKYPPQFTDDKSNDSSMREGIPLDVLNWFGRGYELHTPKSVGVKGQELGLCISPSFFSLPAACRLSSCGEIFTRTRISLALLSLRKNGGLLIV